MAVGLLGVISILLLRLIGYIGLVVLTTVIVGLTSYDVIVILIIPTLAQYMCYIIHICKQINQHQKLFEMTKSKIQILPQGDRTIVRVKNLGVASKREGRSFTVFCPNLRVLGYSTKSEKDAWADFEANLTLFFQIHLTDSTLDKALFSFDWNKRKITTPDFNLDNSPSLPPKDFELAIAA